MATFDAPSFSTYIFNSEAFASQSGYLTIEYANRTYLKLVGGSIFGSLSIGGTLNTTGVVSFTNTTNATSTTTGALIIAGGLGVSKDLYANNIVTTNLTLNGTLLISTASELNYLSGVTPGTTIASKALVVDSSRNLINLNNVGLTTITIGANIIDATDLSYIDGITPGTASASKAVVLDSSRNISSINNLSVSGFLTVGTSGDNDNRINFKGVSGDTSDNFTVIAERLYSGFDKSELLLFKGNDADTTSGPDRIRFRSAEFRFQTYTSAETYNTLQDNNNRLFIQNDGKIGINTISPNYQLDVNGTINTNALLRTEVAGQGFSHNDGTINLVSWVNNASIAGNAYFGTFTNHNLYFQTNNSGRMLISNTGNIGIGNTSPSCRLDLSNGTIRVLSGTVNSPSTGKGIEITYSATNDIGYIYSYDRSLSTYKTLNLNDKVTILGNGNVGIGVTSPNYQLDLSSGGTGINTSSLKFDGTTFNQNYYITVTEGGAVASKAVVLNSDKDYTGIRNLSITGAFVASTSIASPLLTVDTINTSTGLNINYTNLKLNSVAVTSDANELNYNDLTTLGTFQASKTMTLNPSGIGLFGALGNATSNQLRFYGGTSLKEIICMFRDSDDAGLTIASKAQTIQKCSPLLQLYSGYDTSGVVGTSSAEYKEVIRSNHKLVGLSDNYQSGWFHGYLLGTPPWLSSGFGYLTQFYTSMPVLNIAWNTSTTSSYASGSNLLLTSNQIVFGSATPQSGYCLSLYPTTNKGIWMNSVGGAAIYVKTQFGGTTGRSSLDFEDDAGNVYEYGIRGSSDSPSGWYWYVSGGYRMCLLRSSGNLGIGTTGPSAKLQVNGSNTIARFSDGTCNCDIWCNTGGLLGRQVFVGPSTNDALTFQTNNSPRMQIQSNGNVTIGNGPGYYPLHILNSVTGDASYNYYYYKGPGSSNGSTTNTPSSVSMKSEGRLLVTGEVDVISDYRKKKDIEVLSRDYCVDFARKIDPKRFVYKYEDCGLQFGYIAQDLMKNNFGELIMVSENDKMEEHVDEDGFVSEKDKLYTLTRSQVIPLLHGAIKDLYDKIDMLESKLKSQTISRDETYDASDTSSSDLHEIVTSRGRKIKIKASLKDAN